MGDENEQNTKQTFTGLGHSIMCICLRSDVCVSISVIGGQRTFCAGGVDDSFDGGYLCGHFRNFKICRQSSEPIDPPPPVTITVFPKI